MTTTTSAMTTRSLLSTGPETGRGQASLWTAAAAPDHRLWTTLRGPLDPSGLPTCPHPRLRLGLAREQPITTNQRRASTPHPVRRVGAGEDHSPLQVGHT